MHVLPKKKEKTNLNLGLSPKKLQVIVQDRLPRTQKTIRGCTPGGLHHEGFPHHNQHRRHRTLAHYGWAQELPFYSNTQTTMDDGPSFLASAQVASSLSEVPSSSQQEVVSSS